MEGVEARGCRGRKKQWQNKLSKQNMTHQKVLLKHTQWHVTYPYTDEVIFGQTLFWPETGWNVILTDLKFVPLLPEKEYQHTKVKVKSLNLHVHLKTITQHNDSDKGEEAPGFLVAVVVRWLCYFCSRIICTKKSRCQEIAFDYCSIKTPTEIWDQKAVLSLQVTIYLPVAGNRHLMDQFTYI
jgi:hypothetical protein